VPWPVGFVVKNGSKAGRELASTLDLNEVMERILGRVTRLLRAGRAQIFHVDPETSALRCLASAGDVRAEVVVGREFSAGEGVVGRAIALGQPVISSDILTDPTSALPEWSAALSRTHGFTAVIAVPLVARAAAIGVLAVADTPPRTYPEEERALLVAFADHAAVALDNARRQRELADRLRALEANG
jgi:GAF domain-containing protein